MLAYINIIAESCLKIMFFYHFQYISNEELLN